MQAPLTNLYCTNIAKYPNFTTVHIGLDLTYVDCMKNWIKVLNIVYKSLLKTHKKDKHI